MRITRKGQVTIPQDIRRQAGLMPGTDVEFVVIEEGARAGGVEVRLRKVAGPTARPTRGSDLVARLRGRGRYPMPTDEIVRLLRGAPADAETEGKAQPGG